MPGEAKTTTKDGALFQRFSPKFSALQLPKQWEDSVRSLSAAIFLIASTPYPAWPQKALQVPPTTCFFAGEKLPAQIDLTVGDQDLVNAVDDVLKYTGLQANFVVRSSNVADAMAITTDTIRYIVYNRDLMTKLSALTGNRWSAVAVLAHEIGHHLLGHTLSPGGSRPKEELEADRYSGFILERLGLEPEVAWSAVNALTTEIATATHPARTQRVRSVTEGWWEAFRLEHHTPDLKVAASPTPIPQTLYSSSKAPSEAQFVGRAVFYDTKDAPLVTNGSDVIGMNTLGQPVIVAKRLPGSAGYAWIYSGPTGKFGVDLQGRIWKLAASRSQIGYVSAVQ